MRQVPVVGLSPNLGAFLVELRAAIMELQQPTKPHPAYRIASTDLPPPDAFAGCVVDLTDIPTLAKCDGTNWRRVDTGAAL